MGDEWMEASEQGNVAKLNALMRAGTLDRNSPKVANCVVAAAYAGKGQAVVAFLNWGVSPNASDKFSRKLLHSCCRHGLADAVAACLENKADPNGVDYDRGNPMGLALKSKELGCIKELLRVGMEVPPGPGSELPGLAAVMQEVRMETAAKEMRALAGSTVDPQELSEAEERVWASMKEHMRLIKMKEECQSARVLVDLEERARLEKQAALDAQKLEGQIKEQLIQKKTELQTAEIELNKSRKDVDKVKGQLEEDKKEDEKLSAEFDELKGQLRKISKEADALEKARTDSDQGAKGVLDELAKLQQQVKDAEEKNASLHTEIQEAQAELDGWMKDKERAAKLTAQAHALMGNA